MNEEQQDINQSEQTSQPNCQCSGECTCGNKHRRPVYYEIDVNQYVNSLADWD